MNKENDYFEIVIQPDKRWFHIDWLAIFHYRDLLYFLVRREFISRYQQTILGPAWYVIQPLLTTLVFTVIFGNIAKISTDGVPSYLFYLCGLLLWNYFSTCLTANANTFTANIHLFGKVYFPRLVVPFSVLISNLLTFIIQLVVFLGLYAHYKFLAHGIAPIHPNAFVWALPLLVVQTALLSLGVGLWLSALTVKYRDLGFLTSFLVQIWMYATPIIYPVSLIPDKMKWIISLNPMAPIIEMIKYAFFGIETLHTGQVAISVITTILFLFSGLLIFNRIERTFVDTV